MKRATLFLITLGLGMFFVLGGLIGCADGSQSPSSANTTTDTTSNSTVEIGATPTHIVINPVSQKIVTLADNNHLITVKPGTTLELKLDDKSFTHWLVSSSRADVLIPWANAPMPAHVQGIFNAGPAGTAQITATGQPNCVASASSCSKVAQQFVVQIKIG
jgi:ABC-type Fe3+-hydroxamate transport system substrate-binding protein